MSEDRGVGRSRGARGPLPEAVVERFRCPTCGRAAQQADADGLTCPGGHRWAFRDGYLDCSGGAAATGSTAATFASFGFEWNAFDDVRDEDEVPADIYFRDVDLATLAGKVGLDAGCGKGRYTRFVADHLAATVALDGSSAVEAAVRNLGGLPTVAVVRSDLRAAPFAPGSFDFVMSLGVLHHLDDPRAGFEGLVGLLAPGGQLLLYLYSRATTGMRAVGQRASEALRRATVHIPHRLLRVLSVPVAALLYLGLVLPGRVGDRRGIAFLAALPMDAYRPLPFRSIVLDTFDRLSAPVEHRYVWEDLEPWFREAGLVVDAHREETGWFVLAHRP